MGVRWCAHCRPMDQPFAASLSLSDMLGDPLIPPSAILSSGQTGELGRARSCARAAGENNAWSR
jgi:hypothetical protein